MEPPIQLGDMVAWRSDPNNPELQGRVVAIKGPCSFVGRNGKSYTIHGQLCVERTYFNYLTKKESTFRGWAPRYRFIRIR